MSNEVTGDLIEYEGTQFKIIKDPGAPLLCSGRYYGVYRRDLKDAEPTWTRQARVKSISIHFDAREQPLVTVTYAD